MDQYPKSFKYFFYNFDNDCDDHENCDDKSNVDDDLTGGGKDGKG